MSTINPLTVSNTHNTLRRTVLAAAVMVVLLVVYGIVCIAIGWVRAPALVAREMAKADRVIHPSDLPAGDLDMLFRVEDPTFLTNHGVDLTTPGAGMTTMTQGLVKILYFHPFKPGLRKIPQTFYAIGLDARMSKRDLLTLFLNRAGMGTFEGRQVAGFEDAAETYFGKPASELDREQFLALVAMCVGPNAFNVAAHPDRNRERVARIERYLAGQCRPRGWLDVYYVDCASGAP